MVKAKKVKEGSIMQKQRRLKLTPLQRDILVKVLYVTQKYFQPEQMKKMQALREKTKEARKCKLYLNDEEFDCAVKSLNAMRNEFLEAGKNSTCFDRILPVSYTHLDVYKRQRLC